MIWINEFHYDNGGTDTGEFIEIAGAAGTNLTGWKIVLYNGANGQSYPPLINLSGTIPNQQNGYGTLSFAAAGLQNGAPDGFALVDASNVVVQFLSYEGSFTATDGFARGLTSTNVGPSQAGNEPTGSAIHLTGTGNDYSDFAWTATAAGSPDERNNGQSFEAAPPSAKPWINEFHYDNNGGDTGEFVEIAGRAGTSLAGYSILLYNGNGGGVYGTITLSGIIVDQQGGFGTLSFPAPTNGGLQNGSPDGMVLVGPGGVIEFISYEGTITATDGAALGMTSTDVGVSEPGTEPGTSIGRVGIGDEAADFSWAKIADDSPAAVNVGQSFGSAPVISISDVTLVEGDTGSSDFTFTVTRAGGSGAFSVDFVTTRGNATADQDYTPAAGTLAFGANEATKTITVNVAGDTAVEPSETFEVQLFNPTNGALIADPVGVGTIANDDVTITRIHDIQGDAFFSPILAADGINNFNIRSITEVTVRAIVTALDATGARQGFYITEEEGDWDSSLLTSEGLFVMTRNDANNGQTLSAAAPGLTIGETVTVTAFVMEYQSFDNLPRTMLVNPSLITQSNVGTTLPTLVLDGSAGKAIPNAILTDDVPDHLDSKDDAADTFDPQNDALDFFETIEGMRVTLPDMVVADGFVSGADNFIRFKAYSRTHADADQINDRGGYTIAGDPPLSPPDTPDDAQDDTIYGGRHLHDGDTNPDIIELDFGEAGRGGTNAFDQALTMGDGLGAVTGVIDFDFENVKLYVTEAITLTDRQPVQETTTLAADARSLTVATFNVENLDAADPQVRFDRIGKAIADNLKAPDIITIEEIQDNNGAAAGDGTAANGTDAAATWAKLVAAVNAATGENYQWVDELPDYNAEGGEPGGNIRVGFLYNTNRVQLGDLAADATIEQRRAFTDRIGDGEADAGDRIAFNDSQLGSEIDTADWDDTRKSLLGEFVFNGNKVYVVANHWPSKGGSEAFYQFGQDLPNGQPANGGWEKRSALGQDVWTMLDRIQGSSGDNRIVSGGDYNDFYFYRPLEAVTGYVTEDGAARVGGSRFDNLTVTELSEAERYTYAFDGRSQAIDHIVVDQQLSAVAGYDVVHLNTGYNERNGSVNPALSDHDPALAQFDFRSFGETLKGGAGAELIDGFGGNDTLVYAGGRSDYRATLNADGEIEIVDLRAGSPDGRNTVRNVEALVFNGQRFDNLANAAPAAVDDAAAVDEDATSENLWDVVLANDSDVDFYDDTLSISDVDTSATKGSVIFEPETRTLKYVADDDSFDYLFPGQNATDRFSYTVSDGQGGTSTATVEVTVTGRFDTEFRFGGNRDDTLTAGPGEDFLYGGNGNDTLYGLGGHDFLYGDNGNDRLFGGDGNDWLFGGNGDDALDGGAGNDRLAGGNGNDRLTGGEGEDVFVIGRGGGKDQVTDFDTAQDSIFLEWGVEVSRSRVEDVNRDGVLDLNISFSGGGGSVALLGVTDINAVQFEDFGSAAFAGRGELLANLDALIL